MIELYSLVKSKAEISLNPQTKFKKQLSFKEP